MPNDATSREKVSREKVSDLEEKLRSAEKAANRPGAPARDQADLKIIQQEAAAAKVEARRAAEKGPAGSAKPGEDKDSKLDEALKETFPGSDPVALVQPAKSAPKKQ